MRTRPRVVRFTIFDKIPVRGLFSFASGPPAGVFIKVSPTQYATPVRVKLDNPHFYYRAKVGSGGGTVDRNRGYFVWFSGALTWVSRARTVVPLNPSYVQLEDDGNAPASTQSAPVATGPCLTAYWTFDRISAGNYIDETTGYALAPSSTIDTVPGKIGNATRLSEVPAGNQNLQNNAHAPIYSVATSHGFSLYGWVKYSEFNSDEPNAVLVCSSLSGGCSLQITTFNDATVMFIFTLYSTYPTNTLIQAAGGNVGSWIFFAATYDKASQTMKLYINGVLAASNSSAPGPTADLLLSNWSFQFGSNTQIADNTLVDEFGASMWEAITPSQITQLYNGGNGVTWPAVSNIVPICAPAPAFIAGEAAGEPILGEGGNLILSE